MEGGWLGGLDHGVSASLLMALFAKCRRVRKVVAIRGKSGRSADIAFLQRMTPNGPNSASAAVPACGIAQQLTDANMLTLRMAFVGGFAGASIASNVATLHAAPLPTNVASMKSNGCRQFDPGPVGGWRAAAGISGGVS